jgi:hypothetical protein
MTPARIRRLALPVLAMAAWLVAGCGGDPDRRIANRPPEVRLSGGPVEGDSVSYTTEFFWVGWDADGVIDRYQYAIDIPDDLKDELDNPEDVGIAWTDTTAFRARFLFTAAVPDSDYGTPVERARGDHTFYVRAIDNEGAVSTADYVSFTARTVTPRTRITVPGNVAQKDLLLVGGQLNVSWAGEDPDSPDPTRRPAGYEWKLKQMPITWFPAGQNAQYAVDYFAADAPWHRLGRDTTSIRLGLQPPYPYIFAVRSIDEAGGVERVFHKGRNALILSTHQVGAGTPRLTINERTIGTFDFPGAVIEVETGVNVCLRFEMTADASEYGGVIQGYNYGVDADPDDDGPTSTFRGWTLNRVTDPICFSTPGIHTITFKARDTGGLATTGTIILRVIPLSFERDVLLVDDCRRPLSLGITDAMQDARIEAMIEAGGIDIHDSRSFGRFDAFGPGDLDADPRQLRLSDMAGYKMVLWDTWSAAVSRNSLLVRSNACASNRILQAYVGGGGGLWVWGQQTFGGFDVASGASCSANLAYGLADPPGLFFAPGDFLYEFLRLNGGDVRNIRANVERDGLARLVPAPVAIGEGLTTTIEVDTDFYRVTNPVLSFGDVLFQPTFEPTGGLDTLYTYGAARTNSSANRRPNALRFHDPDPLPGQGPVAVFGFPMHFFQQGSAVEGTGTFGLTASMLAWLRRHHDEFVEARRVAPPSARMPD